MNLTMEEMQAVEDSFLEHSGVKNMKWGQRRYQNPDGSLTALGRIHYGIGQRKVAKKTKVMQSGDIKTVLKYRKKLTDEEFDTAMNRIAKTEALRSKERAEKEAKQRAKDESKAAKDQIKLRKEALDNAKDIAKIEAKTKVKQANSGNLIRKGLAIAGSVATAYGTYKKIANMISDLTGKDLPGVNDMTLFGKKGDKSDFSGSKDKKESKETRDTELELGDYRGSDKDKPKPRPFADTPKPMPPKPTPPKPTPKPTPVTPSEPEKGTDDFNFFEVFGLDKTSGNGIIGNGEGGKLRYGGDMTSVDGIEYRRWDPDALSSRKARRGSEGIGSSFVPSLSQERVNTGTEIVKDILYGSIEGTGTHFKNTTTSNFSNNTLTLGMDLVSDILSLPYGPNKKF